MPGGNGMGPSGQGPVSGRGMRGGGRQPEPEAGHPDWLVNAVGTLVLALAAAMFRRLTRKGRSPSEKDAQTGNEEKPLQ